MAGKSRFSPVQLSLNTQAVIDATPIWRVSINNRLCVKKNTASSGSWRLYKIFEGKRGVLV